MKLNTQTMLTKNDLFKDKALLRLDNSLSLQWNLKKNNSLLKIEIKFFG